MAEPKSAVDRFDAAWAKGERVAVAALLAVMGLVVFLDVVHRVSTRSGSWLANPWAVGVVAALVGAAAFATRESKHAALKGALAGVAVAVAQQIFIRLIPSGLVWSQGLALSLTLWLGTVGASLATYERRHLALDVGSKLWPKAWAHRVAALGHAITMLFCLGLLGMSLRSLWAHVDLWTRTDGAADNVGGMGIPMWFASASIPYGMAVMSLRFALEAWKTWNGQVEADADDTLRQLGIAVDAPEAAP